MEITTPDTPALTSARQEYEKVISDPTHPHYDGLRRGDKTASDYVDGLYRNAVPNPAPVEIRNESVSATTDFSEDAAAQAETEAGLRAEFGETYDTVMREMGAGAKFLFDGDEGQQALTALSYRLTGLGPKAEALGIKFLADLSKLQQGGR
jgi:hypothetical protein